MNPTILKSVRRCLGYTQEEMAKALLVSTTLYGSYECQTRSILEPERIQVLLIQLLRDHQAKCEQLKLDVAAVKCVKNPTNERKMCMSSP